MRLFTHKWLTVDIHLSLTLTSGVVQIRGSNGFGQFWPFMGCWGRLPLGCMHTNFGAHWAPRGRAGVPLFFLLGEFCNGWFSSVCDIWEPILGGYGNHPWPLTNHHKKGWAFLSFSARTSFLDFFRPNFEPKLTQLLTYGIWSNTLFWQGYLQ